MISKQGEKEIKSIIFFTDYASRVTCYASLLLTEILTGIFCVV